MSSQNLQKCQHLILEFSSLVKLFTYFLYASFPNNYTVAKKCGTPGRFLVDFRKTVTVTKGRSGQGWQICQKASKVVVAKSRKKRRRPHEYGSNGSVRIHTHVRQNLKEQKFLKSMTKFNMHSS